MNIIKQNLGKVAITVEKDYWNINRYYDRLVIVEVKTKFATYISRKPVPAGIYINNREYWIPFSSLKEELVDNYNAMLNKLNGNITIIEQILDNNKSFEALITQLQTKVKYLLERTSEDNDDPIVVTPTINHGTSQPVGREIGYAFFDEVLGIPIWWNGVHWVNSEGVNVTRYKIATSFDYVPIESPKNGDFYITNVKPGGKPMYVATPNGYVGKDVEVGTMIVVATNNHIYKFGGINWTDMGEL